VSQTRAWSQRPDMNSDSTRFERSIRDRATLSCWPLSKAGWAWVAPGGPVLAQPCPYHYGRGKLPNFEHSPLGHDRLRFGRLDDTSGLLCNARQPAARGLSSAVGCRLTGRPEDGQ